VNEHATVGVISDTHGLLRPEALAALAGSDRIVHAGDVGDEAILDALRAIAPLTVVRGNVDVEPWARRLPHGDVLEVAGARIYVVHDLASLDIDASAAGVGVIVSGHSHRPGIVRRGGLMLVNPGSAGPRRFQLPVSIARLRIENGRVEASIVELVHSET
jgi:putative phosphoesterase